MKRSKFVVLAFMAALLIPLCLCQKVYAQNIMDRAFDGDSLNRQIRSYIINVSNLIPDSTTLQNVWSRKPGDNWVFGIGLNGSFTLLERKLAASVAKGAEGFGGRHNDLSKFPTTVPYLPGTAIDLRAGSSAMDVGVCGMWMDDNILSDLIGSFLGESSHFTYRMLGIDLRYLVMEEGRWGPQGFRKYSPAITVQGGYYFTWMGFGIEAGNTEKVDVQFRNDTYMAAVQLSKDLPIIKPYFGAKLIFSNTDSGFSWETTRPVTIKGTPYPDGASYSSGGNDGELKAYFQLYGGVGINILFFPHLITIGGAYNVATNHFGINMAVRLTTGD
jgi:hypothetical protein